MRVLGGSNPPVSSITKGVEMRVPHVGDIVIYESENGDGVVSPAIVLRTVAATVPGLIEKWQNSLSGAARPLEIVPVLSSSLHVDLLVHGLGGDYRRWNVNVGSGPGTYYQP